MMQNWLEELKKELEKHFYADEVENILEFYEEMIEDRMQSGELIQEVCASLDPKEIVREMLPEVLSKRTNVTQKERLKTTKQLWAAIAHTSLKIPLSILYTIATCVIFVLVLSISISIIGSLVVFVIYGFDLFEAGLTNYEKLGMSGIALVLLSVIGIIFVNIYRLILEVHKKILKLFSQLAKKKGDIL